MLANKTMLKQRLKYSTKKSQWFVKHQVYWKINVMHVYKHICG